MSQMTIQQALDLAVGHHQAGRLQEAEGIYRQVLQVAPQHPAALHLLGVIAHQVHRNDIAIQLISQAIAIHPHDAAFYNNLGEAYRESGNRPKALECYRQALGLNANFAEAWSNVGNVLCELKKPEESREACLKAVALNPNLANAQNNLGNAYEELGEIDKAVACYHRALELNPQFAKALNNLAICQHRLLRFPEAFEAYERSIACDANFADAHWNRALAKLVTGELAEGWRGYEWRWLSKDFPSPQRNFPQPQWKGEALGTRTLLVHCEQGFGDSIQFCRYVPIIRAAHPQAQIVFECQPELMGLLGSLGGASRLIAAGTALPSFDTQIPLLSLPGVFGTTLASIPGQTPYLAAPADRLAAWRERMAGALEARGLGLEKSLKIGICWAGRPTHGDDRNRSAKLADFGPLAGVPGTVFFSLQKGPSAEQAKTPPAGMTLIDLTEHVKDFADTAGLVGNLDLLVSVDTSVVHLAGAIHKPAWVLIPFCPDWRWLLEREDTPWYPTMRLFRQAQRKAGDWGGVMGRIVEALKGWKPEV